MSIEELSEKLSIGDAAALLFKVMEKNNSLSKSKRFGLYPINDWGAFRRAKTLESSRWLASKIKFTSDANDFNSMPDSLKQPLLMCFGFFAVADGGISDLLAYRMILTAESYEQQYYYVVQLDNERVHNETYGKMIYTLISSEKQRDEVFNYVKSVESIRRMTGFIEDAISRSSDHKILLMSLACSEYIMFTPLFCIIFWYKTYLPGKLEGIIFSNIEIAKDEAQHCLNACMQYKNLKEKFTEAEAHDFVSKFVHVVSLFADDALKGTENMKDLTPDNVKQYIRFVADDLLEKLGYSPLYSVSNPFHWMIYTSLVPKENFFEKEVSQYKLYNVDDEVRNAYNLCHGNPSQSDEEILF